LAKSSKRGQLGIEIIIIMVVLLLFGIVAIISSHMADELNEDIQGDDELSETAKSISQQRSNSFPVLLDNAFVFLLVGFWLLMIISNFFVNSHPAFFIFTIIILVLVLFVGVIIGGVQEQIIDSDDELGEQSYQLPKMRWIYDHWLIIFTVIGFSIAITLYSKGGGL
jgi:cell division protein FtsW (lipid II flippase)